ncbi:MAG: hypothetical protein ACOX4R_02430 [Lentihominibacter sp.]|jgi:hypothetical protein
MYKKGIISAVLAGIMAVSGFALVGCGDKDKDSEKPGKTTETTLNADDRALKEKAAEMNKKEDSFYGTWVATSAQAEYLYGNLEITINEDGTFTGNVTDEDFSGKWEKTDKGIKFDSEILSGELFFGDKCKMVIYDEYDTKVTLKKQ